MGGAGVRVENPDEIAGALRQALAADKPTVIEAISCAWTVGAARVRGVRNEGSSINTVGLSRVGSSDWLGSHFLNCTAFTLSFLP